MREIVNSNCGTRPAKFWIHAKSALDRFLCPDYVRGHERAGYKFANERTTMNTAAQFIEQLGIEFPELREDIKEYEGLLHVQMGSFARITQATIDAGDFETLRRQFMFADRFFRDAAPDLENAFYVSYLEHLDFSGPNGQRAQSFMSSALRHGWQEITDYLDELFRKGQGNKRKP